MWTVYIPKKVDKQIKKLPQNIQYAVYILVADLRGHGLCKEHGLTMKTWRQTQRG